MKTSTKIIILAIAYLALALADEQEDGKYRPPAPVAPTTIRPIITTKPYYKYADPRLADPRLADPRLGYQGRVGWPYDQRISPAVDPRYDGRYDSRFLGAVDPVAAIAKPLLPRPVLGNDWRTKRLENKVDALGYHYNYETVGGILAEEVGTFENVGLRNEGVKAQGFVQISGVDGISYRIDYVTESKEAYIPRGDREILRTPPTIIKMLALLESRK